MTELEKIEIQKFLNSPHFNLVRNVLLDFIREFYKKEIENSHHIFDNENLGASIRAGAKAINMIEQAFAELEKLKKSDQKNQENINPAR